MHVLKFGGTSMGDEHTWRRVLNIISGYDQVVVVVSATSRTTRELIRAAQTALTDSDEAASISGEIRARHEEIVTNFLANFDETETRECRRKCIEWLEDRISELDTYLKFISDDRELAPSTLDAVASLGEQISSYLFAECGRVYGLDTCFIDARNVIKTDSSFGKAVPLETTIEPLKEHLSQQQIAVVGGYYGQDTEGRLTTLGFEGSDYTASLIGSSLQADTIEIWTDVSGIYTCDPRVVKEARAIAELSFSEATEMAYFGAKVLHPSTMKPAAETNIPIRVKNIFDPSKPGTKIFSKPESAGDVRAITLKEEVKIITVVSHQVVMGYEFLARVFSIFNELHLPVDVVTTTEASVSVALEIKDHQSEVLTSRLRETGAVSVEGDIGLISLIGCRLRDPGALNERVFKPISRVPFKMISFSSGKQNLNLVVDKPNLIDAVKTLHKEFFPG